MKTGFVETRAAWRSNWRWRGRRYWGGMVMGAWIGLMGGIVLAVELDLKNNWNPLIIVPVIILGGIFTAVSNALVGQPPKEEDKEQRATGAAGS